MTSHISPCWSCGAEEIRASHVLREMMYGTRELFEYAECAACGTLQIEQVPENLGSHYPAGYYSLHPVSVGKEPGRCKSFLRRRIANHMLGGLDLVGWLIAKAVSSAYPWTWFRDTQCTAHSPILDVGCGRGDLLFWLRLHGFDRLHGVDPFISHSTALPGLLIERKELSVLEGEYQLVMSHHSLEHMAEPIRHIEKMKSLCSPGGYLLIRMPVLGASWREYGVDWVELDAPRHLWIPTLTGLKRLMARVGGLQIESVLFDTKDFEFYGSEMYRRDIPLHDPGGKPNDPLEIFSAEEMDGFRIKAAAFNSMEEAGRAVMVIRCTG